MYFLVPTYNNYRRHPFDQPQNDQMKYLRIHRITPRNYIAISKIIIKISRTDRFERSEATIFRYKRKNKLIRWVGQYSIHIN